MVGFIAGIFVVLAVLGIDRLRLDDPVGALSVHLICGIWGTVAAGIFGGYSILWQIIGSLSVAAFAFVGTYIIYVAVIYFWKRIAYYNDE